MTSMAGARHNKKKKVKLIAGLAARNILGRSAKSKFVLTFLTDARHNETKWKLSLFLG